jgi:hypothetical protein
VSAITQSNAESWSFPDDAESNAMSSMRKQAMRYDAHFQVEGAMKGPSAHI